MAAGGRPSRSGEGPVRAARGVGRSVATGGARKTRALWQFRNRCAIPRGTGQRPVQRRALQSVTERWPCTIKREISHPADRAAGNL